MIALVDMPAALDSMLTVVALKPDRQIVLDCCNHTTAGILAELLVDTPADIVGQCVRETRTHSCIHLKIWTGPQAEAMVLNTLDRRICHQSNLESFEVLI